MGAIGRDATEAPADAMTVLAEAVQWLSLASSFEQIQAIVRRTARALTGADGATFVLRERDQCFYVDEDAIAPLWRGQRFPLVDCVSGWAMRHHEPAVIPDIEVDDRVPLAAYRPTFVRSLAMVPIGIETSVGAIGVYWAAPRRIAPGVLADLQNLAQRTKDQIDRIGLDAAPWAPTFGPTVSP